MEPESREPLDRERARKRRAEQIQRRRVVLAVFVLALIVLIVVLLIAFAGGSEEGQATSSTESEESTSTTLAAATYSAFLTGADSVPAVKTEATAAVTLTYDPETKALTYTLEINGLTSPSSAAIYEGAAGTNGTAVVTLFAGPTEEGKFSGVLAEGSIEDTDLTGPLAGKTIGDLIALIKEGSAYASVGNKSHPVDAIRGLLR
jgi:CHRD domain